MTYRGSGPPPRNHFSLPEGRSSGHGPRPDQTRLFQEGWITGAFELVVKTLSPVHVGSGSFTVEGEQLFKDLVRREEKPIIPGSSLKGSCRHIYETLTSSPPPGTGRDPSPAGTLFGSLGSKGRLSFDDATGVESIEPVPVWMSVAYPPGRSSGRRFYGPQDKHADQPLSLPALAIPGEEELKAVLRVWNVQEAELGGVFLALGLASGSDPSLEAKGFHLKLGGGKYDALGWAEFQLRAYRIHKSLGVTPDWIRDEHRVGDFREKCLAAFTPSAEGVRALAQLRTKMQAPDAERSVMGTPKW